MAKSNTCWKIRDTTTGLFWSGDKTGCAHEIGTRFHTKNLLNDTVQRISRDKRHYPKGFPEHWEVLEVELSETVTWTISGRNALIEAALVNDLPIIFDDRFQFDYGERKAGVNIFLNLRRDGLFDTWPYMGLRRNPDKQSWSSFVNQLASYGISEKEIGRRGRWALFATKEAAAMARMADMLKGVAEIKDIRITFARRFGFKTEEI